MSDDLRAPHHAVVDAVSAALAEDLTPLGDITSMLLPAGATASARFVARRAGVVAGFDCATEAFRQVDDSVRVTWSARDGDAVGPGDALGTAEGPLAPILTAERTALNFLGHMSGIATLTRRYVDAAGNAGGAARIWDTRKTTPGLRAIEKAAVRAGGGANHRGNLSDWVMLKDNHLAVLDIAGAVALAVERWPGRTIHVECDSVEQAVDATVAGAGALLLDNMAPRSVREAVAAVESAVRPGQRRPLIEVSGGVTLETVGEYAATGVDMISVGAMTNSAPVLDIGLDIDIDVGSDIDT